MKAGSVRRLHSAFTLFEVLLALSVFSMAAVALVATLNQIGEAAFEARQFRTIELNLESLLDEYSKMPQLEELTEELKGDGDGISYRIEVSRVTDLQNQDGLPLDGIFRILVVAQWKEGRDAMSLEAETMRYSGAFLPIN
jgi:prepilin-type N-terminal cleavage/methylation domain-containing protein